MALKKMFLKNKNDIGFPLPTAKKIPGSSPNCWDMSNMVKFDLEATLASSLNTGGFIL